jgi:methyl-accepting chemotaxis protein
MAPLNRLTISDKQTADSALVVAQEQVRNDSDALALSMARLAQGDLTVRLSIEAQPVNPNAHPQMKGLVGALNGVIASLHETARGFNELTDLPCQRLCYVGPDSFVEGRACGEAMGQALGGQGQVAVVTTFFSAAGPELRRKGFMSVLHEEYPRIQVVNVIEGTETREEAYRKTNELLLRYPNLNGIYVTVAATPHDVARAVADTGRAGQIAIITHDLVDEVMRDIQTGNITATLGQDPFAQGYEPVILLYNHLATGWRPTEPRLLTVCDMITRENWRDFWDDNRGMIESTTTQRRRSRPAEARSPRPVRIAVVGREDAKFWEPVREGVRAAAEALRAYGAAVEWIVPRPDTPGGGISAVAHGQLIDDLVRQKYDGIATAAFNKDYVPYINRAVAAGVPVITYNTEPISLRASVAVIIEQAERLLEYSQQLAATISMVNQATQQINGAMSQVSEGTVSQNEQVTRTLEALNSLLSQLANVTTQANQGAVAAEEATRASQAGNEAVGEARASMQGIAGAVANTAKTVDALGEESDKIDAIVRFISTIAYQIKLLGINAAIEAAHAGQYGAGFLVVAGEIRSLAERTSTASREITDLIDSVKSRIHEVEKVMGSALDSVNRGEVLSDRAGQVLGAVQGAVGANLERLTAITAAISQMQGFSGEVGQAMDLVAGISERNAAAVEEVTASTEEMSGQLQEVAGLARTLAAMADTTRQLLAKFNLGEKAESPIRALRPSS